MGKESADLELVEGHIHQAWDSAMTGLVEVWPTARRGWWHVAMRASQCRATEEPIPADQVPELIAAWDFLPEKWRHWPGQPREDNPGRRGDLGERP